MKNLKKNIEVVSCIVLKEIYSVSQEARKVHKMLRLWKSFEPLATSP